MGVPRGRVCYGRRRGEKRGARGRLGQKEARAGASRGRDRRLVLPRQRFSSTCRITRGPRSGPSGACGELDLPFADNCEIWILENEHRATPPHPFAATGLDQVLASRRQPFTAPRTPVARKPLDRRGLKRVHRMDDSLHNESRRLVRTGAKGMRDAYGFRQRSPPAIADEAAVGTGGWLTWRIR